MKLVKIEKDFCPACNQVGAFLDNEGVSYEKYNIQGTDENADKAREILGNLGLFTVPVTVVLDNEGSVQDHARGMDAPKLAELVEAVK